MKTEFPEVFQLDEERKFKLIDALLLSIQVTRSALPLSDDVRAMLDESEAEFESTRHLGRPWREVMDELERRHA